MDRLSLEPNLSIKWSFSIGTMINFDGDGHGMCKQALQKLFYAGDEANDGGGTRNAGGTNRLFAHF